MKRTALACPDPDEPTGPPPGMVVVDCGSTSSATVTFARQFRSVPTVYVGGIRGEGVVVPGSVSREGFSFVRTGRLGSASWIAIGV